uniref:Uncharacterized protein n=1 Tax=Timema bartmani TaxID=61472 RepID=A0A7R9I204_9NEOP|nr:unnamed protein product [Timema bartmani]
MSGTGEKAKLETKALKAKRPGFTDDRYNETSYYIENANCFKNRMSIAPRPMVARVFVSGRWREMSSSSPELVQDTVVGGSRGLGPAGRKESCLAPQSTNCSALSHQSDTVEVKLLVRVETKRLEPRSEPARLECCRVEHDSRQWHGGC